LAVADVAGVMRWATVQGASIAYGDVVGLLFAQSIDATWSLLYPPVLEA